ncbi:hypothetical protein COV93_06155 [Candidatus Woesearchaeota archaeon CG11_big_fil_rev_8_21_14_0_20_43_8]|nr:MAG: hypothetical protein COV93_06155 [Candidatus Woesearchaeota archaeon CG11_big_fil_rev_8_21_14_0_20_43_8]PIO05404.1 MAG: hypothetical protein COT47_04925 [Candidatus Woesearchaeota archaeon CG08_land_8_20_14_0_20_43_7]
MAEHIAKVMLMKIRDMLTMGITALALYACDGKSIKPETMTGREPSVKYNGEVTIDEFTLKHRNSIDHRKEDVRINGWNFVVDYRFEDCDCHSESCLPVDEMLEANAYEGHFRCVSIDGKIRKAKVSGTEDFLADLKDADILCKKMISNERIKFDLDAKINVCKVLYKTHGPDESCP